MKKSFRILTVLLAVLLVCGVLASCSGGSDKTESKADTDTKTEETVAEKSDEVDYNDIALTIEDGDFDGICDFLENWDSGAYDNKVIKVTGISERRMSNCTVLEKDSDGTGRGFSWEIIDGNFPDDYPAEDAKVTLVGVLTVTNEYGARALMVPAENVTVIE